MVNKSQKIQMRDYLVSRLEPSYSDITPKSKEILSGITSNYILIGENSGIVLLVDRVYPRDSFGRLFRSAKSKFKNVMGVVFKDGETFFRSAAERNYFKKDKMLSLKRYSNFDINRMILLRPEEIFLNSQKEWVHYFQPKSDRLTESLESFKFEKVIFDYNHIDKYERFKPNNMDSKRLHIWKNRVHSEGDLKIVRGHLT